MNTHCECPKEGFCARHNLLKSIREYELCKGIAGTPDGGLKYWKAWEQGRLGATAPEDPNVNPPYFYSKGKKRSRGLGDRVARATRAVGIKPCRGCKGRQAKLNHYFPSNYTPVDPRPFTGPIRRNLLYHVYPDTANRAVWQRNVENIVRRIDLFNGHRAVGIVTARHLDPPGMVIDAFQGHVTDFIISKNLKKRREVVTFVPLLEKVESRDPNEVTFYAHAKGVTHRDGDWTTVHRWGQAMYDTCLDYWPLVEQQLATKAMTGSFKRYGQFRTRGNWCWHYSGTFYWFRNCHVYERNWRYVDKKFFGNESWPGLMFKPEDTACLFFDNAGELYKMHEWNTTVQPELEKWTSQQSLALTP